jgi:hypothetical protein
MFEALSESSFDGKVDVADDAADGDAVVTKNWGSAWADVGVSRGPEDAGLADSGRFGERETASVVCDRDLGWTGEGEEEHRS